MPSSEETEMPKSENQPRQRCFGCRLWKVRRSPQPAIVTCRKEENSRCHRCAKVFMIEDILTVSTQDEAVFVRRILTKTREFALIAA
jgi:hypothetical protein